MFYYCKTFINFISLENKEHPYEKYHFKSGSSDFF